MGLDLTLCPDRHSDGLGWFLAHTRIDLDRHYDVFGQISETGRSSFVPVCKPQPLPRDARFDWYGDDGIERKTVDPYGTKLTDVSAGELARVDVSDSTPWNKAVFEMMKALPDDIRVVLYWH